MMFLKQNPPVMPTTQVRSPKLGFKLPKDVPKGSVIAAFSTSKNVFIEGYTGEIKLLDRAPAKSDTLLPCRANTNGKAWVEVRKK